MTCIQKFHLFLLNTSNIFTWLLIYQKNAQISLRYHLEVTSQLIPPPSHPHLGQMSRRPNVVLYFKTNNLCTRFEGISDSNVQSRIQSFNLFDRIKTIMNLYRGRFSHCHYFFWKVFELFVAEEFSEGGGGGYSRIKVKGVLVGKFREHP